VQDILRVGQIAPPSHRRETSSKGGSAPSNGWKLSRGGGGILSADLDDNQRGNLLIPSGRQARSLALLLAVLSFISPSGQSQSSSTDGEDQQWRGGLGNRDLLPSSLSRFT